MHSPFSHGRAQAPDYFVPSIRMLPVTRVGSFASTAGQNWMPARSRASLRRNEAVDWVLPEITKRSSLEPVSMTRKRRLTISWVPLTSFEGHPRQVAARLQVSKQSIAAAQKSPSRAPPAQAEPVQMRSEERRGGKECGGMRT